MYEGHPPEVVVAPARIAAELGVEVAIITNAAGAVNRRIGPGDLMLFDDHINLMWRNPLVGPVPEGESRFPDMSAPYDPRTPAGRPRVRGSARRPPGARHLRGDAWTQLRDTGGDPNGRATRRRRRGMSTVPEVLALRARNVRVWRSPRHQPGSGDECRAALACRVMAVAEQAGAASET